MREKKRGPAPLLIILAVVLALSIGASAWFLTLRSKYTSVDGVRVSVDATELDLRDRGITTLRGLERCAALQSLDLRGNELSIGEIRALRGALPDCEILYDIYLDGTAYDARTDKLSLPDLPSDWENILAFSELVSLRVERCSAPAAMDALRQAMPRCAMSWTLSLGGEWYDPGIEDLRIPGEAVYFEELLAQLGWFENLRSVELPDAALNPIQQRTLRDTFPAVDFRWQVSVGGQRFPSDLEEMTFAPGQGLDVAGLEAVLDLLPALRRVDFTDSTVPAAQRTAFLDAHPEMDVSWTVSLEDNEYPWDLETLDLNGRRMADTAALEEALPYLPRLQTVEMCDCGLSNQVMADLNARYEGVKFVWRVYFGQYNLRTDATDFIASAWGSPAPPIYDSDTEILRYCTELRALDLGHQYFTNLEFVKSMPHITWLIVAECPISDLSPLAGLEELIYLEAFQTYVRDLSPLLECPALQDLNMCYTDVPAGNILRILSQMKQLQRLWWCSIPLTKEQRWQLQNSLPDTITFFIDGGEPSGGQWRYHPNYCAMRDAFHNLNGDTMWYMPGGTNGTADGGTTQIIVDDWGETFYLEMYDGSWYWWLSPKYAGMYYPHIIGVTC